MKILLVGVARSGTSFLGEAFNQNPEVIYFYEPFWGNTIIKERQCIWLTDCDHEPQAERLLKELFNGQFDELESHQPQPWNRKFASRREELMHQLRGRSIGATTDVVIKEIRLNMQLRWVVKVIGAETRIVHLIRDPRGVAASFLLPVKKKTSRSAQETILRWLSSKFSSDTAKHTMYSEWEWNKAPEMQRFAPQFHGYGPCLETGEPHQKIASRWALATGHAMADSEKISPQQYYRVRYEDLCRDPVGVCSLIYQFLGRTMPTCVTEWLAENTREGSRDDRHGTSRNSAEMIDVWRSQLRRRQIREIESLCGPLMETLGYL